MLENNSTLQQAQVYTNLNALSNLRSAAKNSDPEAIEAVAGQFEALFLHLMLKSMRDANAVFSEGNYLNSHSVETYQQMLDQQLSVSLTQGSGLGLKEILIRQLGNPQETTRYQSKLIDNKLAIVVDDKKPPQTLTHEKTKILSEMSIDADSRDLSTLSTEGEMNRQGITQPSAIEIPESRMSGMNMLHKHQSGDIANKENIGKIDFLLTNLGENPQQFVSSLAPMAESVASELGVDPKLLIAQAALETGWGKHLIKNENGNTSFNLFNIKAGSNWQGKTVTKNVVEYRDGVMMHQASKFRAYDSFQESFRDYVDFVKNNPRYEKALEPNQTPVGYINALHQAGYATDPQYSSKVTRVYQRMATMQGI